MLYLGWRGEDLLMVLWVQFFGFEEYRQALRAFAQTHTIESEFILYSFPDLCWIYATTDSEFKTAFSISQKYPFQPIQASSSSKRKFHREKNSKSHPNLG